MSTVTPKVLSRKANGVPASQSSADGPKAPRARTSTVGEKVCIRYLPPALTEDEFWTILGDAWKPGKGKVGYFTYWPGSVSRHPSKPSRPSRADLHIIRRDELLALSDVVRTAQWIDAKGTHTDPALLSPPVVQISFYKKVPGDKKRVDSRQGTIDQDPDFMAFLESLANPNTTKESEPVDQALEEMKGERPTTTPLIEHLREKAAKAKEAAAAKSAKHSRQESQGGKGKSLTSTEDPKRSRKDARSERPSDKSGRASDKPRETVKILSKKEAIEAASDAAKVALNLIQARESESSSRPSTTETPPRSRRAGIAAAARILQRDLGLSPGNAHRKARQEAAKADAEAKVTASKEASAEPTRVVQEPTPSPTPSEPLAASGIKTQAAPSRRGRGRARGGAQEEGAKPKNDKGDSKTEKAAEPAPAPPKTPIILKRRDEKKNTTPPPPSPSPAPTASSAAAPVGPKSAPPKQAKKGTGASTPTPGATRAFIRNAVHSQGITEAALRQAMQTFGTVSAVEMDRKKSLAYVDFTDHEGLAKAMAASPVAVAQGSVQVLERKEFVGKKKEGGKESKETKDTKDTGKGAANPPATAESSTASQAASAAASAGASGNAAADKGPGEKHRGRRRGGRGRGDKDTGGKESAAGSEKRLDAAVSS
ncbi:Smg-4/UPF3 family-domain-containing protein [Echria macrotheca]|uniref:Smg-4/UPF3 family-domain-containing protein n=1 Tax=Echria macrotheca TaxID=438768 RepID=A0AAJ0BN94_9PEZI|nr:Smg-4/UPF3 family-domain-containing protein [Echria macrotheca]